MQFYTIDVYLSLWIVMNITILTQKGSEIFKKMKLLLKIKKRITKKPKKLFPRL